MSALIPDHNHDEYNHLHPEVQVLLEDAHLLGWAVYAHNQASRKRDRGYRLVSPINSNVTIDIPPVRQWNEGKLRAIQERLLRYSDPDKVEQLARIKERRREREEAEAESRRQAEELLLREAEKRAAELQAANPAINPVPTPGPSKPRGGLVFVKDPEPETQPEPESEPTIVTQHPWFVRHGERDGVTNGYDSKQVIQREWSDGHTDFACVKDGCDYTNIKAQSVATHYNKAPGHPKVAKATKEDHRLNPDYQAHTPFRARTSSKRKATTVPATPEADTTTTTTTAPAATEDAAEMLAKVRELVGGTEVAKLREYIAELEAQVVQEIEAKEAAQAEAETAKNELEKANKTFAPVQALIAAMQAAQAS